MKSLTQLVKERANSISQKSGYTSIRNDIDSIDTAQQQSAVSSMSSLLKARTNNRNKIATGQQTSGNEAADYLEMRKGSLIDGYVDFIMQSPDISGNPNIVSNIQKAIKTDPDSVLNRFKAELNDSKKSKAIDDYIMKGGNTKNTLDYLLGHADNPYGIVNDDKGIISEQVQQYREEAPGWASTTADVAIGLGSQIPEQALGLTSMFLNSKFGRWLNEKTNNSAERYMNQATTEEYNNYKSGKEVKDLDKVTGLNVNASKRNLFNEYDEAKDKGFVGSIEEYKDYRNSVNQAAYDAVVKKTKTGLLNENDVESSKSMILGDFVGNMLEYIALPMPKGFKVTKGTSNSVLKTMANAIIDGLYGGVEQTLVEGTKDTDKMNTGELGVNTLINTAVSSIVRAPGIAKAIKDMKSEATTKEARDLIDKTFSDLPDNIRNYLKQLKPEEFNAIKEAAKNEAAGLSSVSESLRGQLGEEGIQAVEQLKKDHLAKGKELGDMFKNLGGEYEKLQGYTDMSDALSTMNESFKKLETDMGNVKWGDKKAPQFSIKQDKKTGEFHFSIKNVDSLNNIKNENGDPLGEAIQTIWDRMFNTQGLELNDATLYAFFDNVKGTLEGAKWNWKNEAVNMYIEGLNNVLADMKSKFPEELIKTIDERNQSRILLERAEKSLGVDSKSYKGGVGDLEKMLDSWDVGKKMTSEDNRAVIEVLSKRGYLPENIEAKTAVSLYMLARYNPEALVSFKQMYPSKAGFIEKLLEAGRDAATSREIDNIIGSITEGSDVPMGGLYQNDIWNRVSNTIGGGIAYGRNMLGGGTGKIKDDNDLTNDAEYQKRLQSQMRR